jgi:chaperonin GroEL
MLKKKYAQGSAVNNFVNGNDDIQTRWAVKEVAKSIGGIIGNTIGPGGRNYMTPEGITNDGVSILKHIRFSDERMDSIADAFMEVARRQDQDAGDGTTTATLLATALTPLVLEDVADITVPLPGQKTVMQIKAQLEKELTEALALLEKQKTQDVSLEELKMVANTAMEGHECSDLLAETVHEVGYNSNTSIQEGFSGKVEKLVVPGIHMPLKIEAPIMFTNAARKEATHKNAIVIVANHVFEDYNDLAVFMNGMITQKKEDGSQPQPLVIVGKHFSVQFTAQVATVSRSVGLPILLLNANGLRDEEFQDIAAYCNARYIDTTPKGAQTMASYTFGNSGEAKEIIAGPKQTSFVGGRGIEAGEVSTRIADLKELISKEQNPAERDLLMRRAAGLEGGVATLYVDAKTAVDRYYLKKKVEDAVNSCKAAMQYGTAPGGGMALAAVAGDMDSGYLKQALNVIYNRVQANAGGSLDIDTSKVRDAFWTQKCALENAVGVVKILVTMEGVIADVDTSFVDDLSQKLGYEN